MTASPARAVQWTAVLVLSTFAAMKFAAPAVVDGRPAWLHATLLAVASAEACLAVWLAVDHASRRPVIALACLGVAFVVASAVAPPSWLAGDGCGCLGAVRLERGHRVIAGGVLVLLAGLRLALAPPVGTRGAAARQ